MSDAIWFWWEEVYNRHKYGVPLFTSLSEWQNGHLMPIERTRRMTGVGIAISTVCGQPSLVGHIWMKFK